MLIIWQVQFLVQVLVSIFNKNSKLIILEIEKILHALELSWTKDNKSIINKYQEDHKITINSQ